MRADIDFSKLSGTQLSKGKRTLIFTLYFLLVVVVATVCAVYAYFTSMAEASGNLYFGEISVNMLDGENSLNYSNFKTKFTNITPGDTLDLSNINIKNTGTHSAYVLMNVDVEISNAGAKTLHYNQWYNVHGEEVNINDMAANTTAPTNIAKGGSATTFIKWKVPSEAVDNQYKNGVANVTLSAYACQINLEEAQHYVDADLYASYYICKTATETAETTTSKNLLTLDQNFEWTGCYSYYVNVPAGTYTISWSSSVSGSTSAPYLHLKDNVVGFSLTNAGGSKTLELTTDETIIYLYANGYNYQGSQGVTSSVQNLMVEKGEVATSYEPFIKGSKNLIDLSTTAKISSTDNFELNNNTVVFNNTGNGYGIKWNNITLKPNTMYTVSCSTEWEISKPSWYGWRVYDVTGKTWVLEAKNTDSYFFTTNSNTIYNAYYYIGGGHTEVGSVTISNIQLEEGSVATVYEPYYEFGYKGVRVGGEPLMKVQGKNLVELKDCNVEISGASMNYSVVNQVLTRTSILSSGVSTTYLIQTTAFNSIIGTQTLNAGTYIWKYHHVSGTVPQNPYITLTLNSGGQIKWYSENTVTIDNTATISQINSTDQTYFSQNAVQSFKIQIERGDTATSWEAYNCVQDTIDYSTMQVTRNIGKYEFTGNETLYVGYDQLYLINSAVLQYTVPGCYEVDGYGTMPVLGCNYLDTIKSTYIATKANEGISIIPDDNPYGAWVRFRINVDTYGGTTRTNAITEFKAWLKDMYEKGTPFTIWFKLESASTESVFTNKNLYQGQQSMYYERNAYSNCNGAGAINITQGKDALLSPENSWDPFELGGNLFDYIKDKQITISCRVKIYPDDNRTNTRISISYFKDKDDTTSIQYATGFTNEIPKDGRWHYYWVTLDAFTNYVTTTTTEGLIKLMFADYGSQTHTHFELKDLQLEVGSSPTDYEPYDKTAYARVNGNVLRTVNGVSDTYAYNYDSSTGASGTITRYIKVHEFTGEENWIQYSDINTVGALFYTGIIEDKKIGYQMSICSHFTNINGIWNSTYKGVYGIYSEHPSMKYLYVRPTSSSITTPEQFKTWLKQQKANGNGVKLYYQLATATTETI